MNYGISVLFRAIPLAMALFCFGYGAFISAYGDDSNRLVAGPVVFSLGMICIALFATAAYYYPANHTYLRARFFICIAYYRLSYRCCHNCWRNLHVYPIYLCLLFRSWTCSCRSGTDNYLCSNRSNIFYPFFIDSCQLKNDW